MPFGKRLAADGVHLEDNPEEQTILDEIQTLREQGLSLRLVAEELNRQGVDRRNGGDWHKVAVHRVLKEAVTE